MTFSVVATDGVSEPGMAPLAEDELFDLVRVDDSSSEAFVKALARCHGLIVRSATTVDVAMIDLAPELKVIGRAGVGVDNVDVAAATDRGIAVLNAPGGNTTAATELTMALILAAVRRLPEADRSIREGRWDKSAYMGVELRGRTLGLIGAGRIGGEVAVRCQAFGMGVIVYDPYLTKARADELGVELVELDRVLDEAHVISIHVPLTDETTGLVGLEALQQMRDDAYVVNASRGGVIDEAALAQALHEGWIAGAGLDVFTEEPLPAGSPLRTAPNLVLTPHLGASTAEAQVAVASEVAIGLKAVLVDGDTSMAVNAADLV